MGGGEGGAVLAGRLVFTAFISTRKKLLSDGDLYHKVVKDADDRRFKNLKTQNGQRFPGAILKHVQSISPTVCTRLFAKKKLERT